LPIPYLLKIPTLFGCRLYLLNLNILLANEFRLRENCDFKFLLLYFMDHYILVQTS